MDTWQQVSISVTREAVEATANLFCEAGAHNGVEIDDPLLLKELKEHTTWELCDLPMPEETEIVTVSAYYPEDEELSGRLSTIKEGLSEIEKRIGSFQVGQLRFRKVSEKIGPMNGSSISIRRRSAVRLSSNPIGKAIPRRRKKKSSNLIPVWPLVRERMLQRGCVSNALRNWSRPISMCMTSVQEAGSLP